MDTGENNKTWSSQFIKTQHSAEFSTWMERHANSTSPAEVSSNAELGELAELPLDELVEIHACLGMLEQVWPKADEIPEKIGPYHLLRCLGRGGMGEVWEAQQHEPIQRRLAIKLIRTDLFSQSAIQRFKIERQVLAKLEHPNVARIVDAGTTESSQLYFVMELIDGIPIASYCRENNLSLHDRIQLMASVCSGVQHAHQKGIIHRDLKPANILITEVDGNPMPKIIDFGLAKLAEDLEENVASGVTDDLSKTQLGSILGTLEYMSPEQARGDTSEIDTRADVYSLGVILFELLTGTTPIRIHLSKGVTKEDALKLIADSPPSLSDTASGIKGSADSNSERRAFSPSELKTDLDWIVKKSLSKSRDDRYANIAEFSNDLQRSIDDQPVQARPYTLGYGLKKFYRRHAAIATATLLLAFTLVAGIIGTTSGWLSSNQARKLAETNLVRTQQSNKILTDIFADLDIKAVDRSNEPLQMVFAGRLTRAGQQILDSSLDNPVESARMLADVGQSLKALGFPSDAIPFVRQAYEIGIEQHGLNSPLANEYRVGLACVLRNSGAYQAARQLLVPLLDLYRGEERTLPAELISVLEEFARLNFDEGEYENAILSYEEALLVREQQSEPSEFEKSETEFGLASCYLSMNVPDKARPIMEKVLEYRRAKLPPAHPEIIRLLDRISLCCESASDPKVRSQGYQMAKECYELSLETYGRHHQQTYSAMVRHGSSLFETGNVKLAQEFIGDAIVGLTEAHGANHPKTAAAKSAMSQIYYLAEDWEQSLQMLESSLEYKRSKFPPGHPSLVGTQIKRSRILIKLKEYDRALEELSLIRKEATETRQKSSIVIDYGALLSNQGDHRAALDFMAAVAKSPEEVSDIEYVPVVYRKISFARILSRAGETEKSMEQLDECSDIMQKFAPQSPVLNVIAAHRGVVMTESGIPEMISQGVEIMENFARSGMKLQDSNSFFQSLHDAYEILGAEGKIEWSINKSMQFFRRSGRKMPSLLARRTVGQAEEAIRFELWELAASLSAEAEEIYNKLETPNERSWPRQIIRFHSQLAKLGVSLESEKELLDVSKELEEMKVTHSKLIAQLDDVFRRDELVLRASCQSLIELLESNELADQVQPWMELPSAEAN